jgi:DNA-binding NarL/FixJ family response regulator
MPLLLADHTTYRRELRVLLEAHAVVVAEEVDSGMAAIRRARDLAPTLTVVDLGLPDLGGVEVTEAILFDDPGARVLVLAGSHTRDQRAVLDALIAGACGYLVKGAPAETIVAGVRAAAAGKELISPIVATRLVARYREQRRARDAEPPGSPPLTRRERDVLRLLAQGRPNSAIAAELRISRSTVKTHVARLLEKLELENRVQAAVFAVRHGIG